MTSVMPVRASVCAAAPSLWLCVFALKKHPSSPRDKEAVTIQWDDISLQNRVWGNAQRFAFSGAIRARRPPPAPPRGRDLRLQNPLGGVIRPLRLFKNTKVREFLIAVLGLKSGFGRAIGPLLHRNKHAVGLQRRPRCNPIAAPLRSRKGPAARPHPALPKGRETCVIVSGCVIVSCENNDFSTEKTVRF